VIVPAPDGEAFADEWVQAWNAHDVESVLTHFHDDVVFTSPVAARLLPETGGVVRGKGRLRDYWVHALSLLPDLHFEVVGVYQGESVVVINYRNQKGQLVNEVLVFDGDLVREGHGTYLTPATVGVAHVRG
jgi:ketosteroid isomerase-like protein